MNAFWGGVLWLLVTDVLGEFGGGMGWGGGVRW